MDSAIIRNEIYRIVRKIPRGSVLSYGDIGRIVGTGPRQVAAAMRACPAGLPWHRVVGAGGEIKLPAEAGFEQRFRLQSEGVTFRGSRVEMKQHEVRLTAAKSQAKSKSKTRTRPR